MFMLQQNLLAKPRSSAKHYSGNNEVDKTYSSNI